MSKVVVTGGAGFIGSHLVDALLEAGHNVTVIDDLSVGKKSNIPGGVELAQIDVCDRIKVQNFFAEHKPDIVFHLAAQINVRESLKDPYKDAQINILGSVNVFESAVKNGASKIVFASSGGVVYGDQASQLPYKEDTPLQLLSPYAISKRSAEMYLEHIAGSAGVSYTVMRYANVFGPRQDPAGEAGVISIFISQLLNSEVPKINGDGNQTRDYVFVGDLVDAHLKAIEKNSDGVFNIGVGQEISVNDLYGKIASAVTSTVEPEHGDPIDGEVRRSALTYDRAYHLLSWKPKHSLEDGLSKTVEWFRER